MLIHCLLLLCGQFDRHEQNSNRAEGTSQRLVVTSALPLTGAGFGGVVGPPGRAACWAATSLPSGSCNRSCINRALERNEEHTGLFARATPTVHRLRRAVRVHAGSENGRLLAIVGDMKFA
jgi:hypothetical protein